MKGLRRILGWTLLAVLALAGFAFSEILRLGFAFRAKLACSCRYVTLQNEEACSKWADDPKIPEALARIDFDDARRSASVGFGPYRATAEAANPENGCTLQP